MLHLTMVPELEVQHHPQLPLLMVMMVMELAH
jgi:hypothetical protein